MPSSPAKTSFSIPPAMWWKRKCISVDDIQIMRDTFLALVGRARDENAYTNAHSIALD